MLWHTLDEFLDPSIPKLRNLARAAQMGMRVPPTFWARAEELEAAGPQAVPMPTGLTPPCILRSGSPTEDSVISSNAGRFLSSSVREAECFAVSLAAVIAALPAEHGRRQGVVFAQPLIEADEAGVTFFDGFYFEETAAAGGNQALTSGRERGQVRRGHLMRGDPHSDWLLRLHKNFGGRIDVEWAGGAAGQSALERWVLQVRPALFPIRRCETLSLANHKEILGDPPSPWIVGVLVEVGRSVMDYFALAEPTVRTWQESYAVDLAERAWLNLSAFFRLMDCWGLPRTMVTDGVGGEAGGPLDNRYLPRRFWFKLPNIARMALINLYHIAVRGRGLRALDDELKSARTLRELQRANVRALAFSIRTNFAIISVLAVTSRLRKRLGLKQAAEVTTHRMMARYGALAALPKLADRLKGLDEWLEVYGHRGPFESDPCQPRFSELRPTLRAALECGPLPPPSARQQPSVLLAKLARVLFLVDEVREQFRDRLMHIWQELRELILAEAEKAAVRGDLERVEDVFFLRAEDLDAAPSSWRARVAARRERWGQARGLDLPTTASRDIIADALAHPGNYGSAAGANRFLGIGLGSTPVTGVAVRATDLRALLKRKALPENPILIASSLEPSWGVIFPRFAAVVAELGGELSHAAILLREAGIPAVVNAKGAFHAIADGDRIVVDPARGEVVIEVPLQPDAHHS